MIAAYPLQWPTGRDIPKLLRVPARVHFISYEPALGPIDIRFAFSDAGVICCRRCGFSTNRLTHGPCPNDGETLHNDVGIDWVIAGGESGRNARPMHPAWARSLRDQCSRAGVPFLFKQWGEFTPVETTFADYMNPIPEHEGERVALPNGTFDGIIPDAEKFTVMRRIGKKAAGRLLDGRTWDGYPEVCQ